MDCYKEKAVAILIKEYMSNTHIPYEQRYKKSMRSALEYMDKMIKGSKTNTERTYYNSILFYLKKINVNGGQSVNLT
jgi:hypothetical protein